MKVTGLRQVALHADDLDRAEDFYQNRLGLAKIARFDPPGLLFFQVGDVRLLLERGAPASLIYLVVDDLDAACAALGDDVVVEPPHLIHRDTEGLFGPPGAEEWMAGIRDSEGNIVVLTERRAAR